MGDNWDQYEWIVVVGGLLAFFTAYGIRANDVANAFATSVGAKALTIQQAVIIAAIFEFAGSVLLGASVTDTIRKNVAETDEFVEDPEVLMYGMLCVIAATGIWLLLASYLELPVSTTHSVIGKSDQFCAVVFPLHCSPCFVQRLVFGGLSRRRLYL